MQKNVFVIVPRIEFGGVEQLKNWVKDHISIEKSKIYLSTVDNAIIVVPKKSTPPIEYGYLELSDINEAKKIVDEIVNEAHVKVYEIAQCKLCSLWLLAKLLKDYEEVIKNIEGNSSQIEQNK